MNGKRIAVIGSGPSGFYSASALLKSVQPVEVDLFDRLPVPFGLVRSGVAPDKPKIKSVQTVFERVSAEKGFRFLGNVNVGYDVTVEELRTCYDAVLFAYGAEAHRDLGIPGENLAGSLSANAFTGWYNGHADYADIDVDLSHPVAVVIGMGNVAVDVARILVKSVEELHETDIADHALQVLEHSKVREVYVVGRRGPAQASYTLPEIKEFGEIEGCDPMVRTEDLDLNEASRMELERSEGRNATRMFEVLKGYANRTPSSSNNRRIFLRFYRMPSALLGAEHVKGIELEEGTLEGEAGQQRVVGTGRTERLDCGLVVRCIGYRGRSLPGLPFDERRGIVPNRDGRVIDGDQVMPGVYAAGWIRHGPVGLIGTTRKDAGHTVGVLLSDLADRGPKHRDAAHSIDALLTAKKIRVVTFEDWRRIDAAEQQRGQAKGKPREKFCRIGEMLDVLR